MTKPDKSGGGEADKDAPGAEGESQAEGEETTLPLEIEVESTAEERIAELEGQSKENYDKYLRSVAELDNVRKRSRKEIEDARVDAQSRALREMLPVIDNLERAVAHAETGGDGAGILEGVRLVLRQFLQALERLHVHPIAAEGKTFDPAEHEAVSQAETADAPAGTVVEVLQTGYKIGDRLLRPAMVVVARPPAEKPAGPNGRGPAPGQDPEPSDRSEGE